MELTSNERFRRMFQHRDADRIPITDEPWGSTIERWHREGLPAGMDFTEYFDLDRVVYIGADNSPRLPAKVLEETEEYVIYTSAFGVTMKQWKHATSTPEFLDFTVVDRDSWEKAKERMTFSMDRVDWQGLERDYRSWRERGAWIQAGGWFGFDVTHSWFIGTERGLMAVAEDPEWLMDIFGTMLELQLALFDKIWDAGYTFDCFTWPDDMGYKQNQFFSRATYREMLLPFHKRACDWAHAKGVVTRLHSCGFVEPFIPDYIDIGIDCLNPLEVKAGMNPLALKEKFGDRLCFHGGINAVLWDDTEAITEEMRRVIPGMKKNGGYIFSSDHSVPNTVSLEEFRYITDLAKKLGSY